MLIRIGLALLATATLGIADGGPALSVVNAGKGGHSSRNLLGRYDADVKINQPELVIIGAGTNDAINSGNSVPMAEYASNLRKLIQKSRGLGAAVVVLSPLPCMDEYVRERHEATFFAEKSPSEKILEYVEVQREVCKAEQVPLVDIYQLFLDRGSIGEVEECWLQNVANSRKRDGVHPTAAGYAAIAEAVHQKLLEAKIKADRVVCLGDSITYGAGVKNAAKDRSYPVLLEELLRGKPVIE